MEDATPTKTCKICGQSLPLTEFYRHKATRDGYETRCKPCVRAASQMHKGIKNPLTRRRFPLAPPGWKFCLACHYLLPLEAYHRDSQSPDGRTYRCTDCAKQAARASYQASDKAARKERTRAYFEANREHLLNRQREYVSRYRQKYSLIKRSYRSRLRAEDGLPFTKGDILRLYRAQRGECHYCGVPLRKVFELDHVVPISKGGGNEPGNVVIACPWCSKHKRDLDVDVFIRRFLRAT